MSTGSHAALFLDRDGTLIDYVPYLHEPDKVVLRPGATEALRAAREVGCRLYLFTNQSGVARGYFPLEDAEACNQRLIELLGMDFDGIMVAIEPPGSTDGYRKPSPRYIQERITADQLDPARCYIFGDNRSDIEAGLAAGIHAAAIADGAGCLEDEGWDRYLTENRIPKFQQLGEAVPWALEQIRTSAKRD